MKNGMFIDGHEREIDGVVDSPAQKKLSPVAHVPSTSSAILSKRGNPFLWRGFAMDLLVSFYIEC